MTPEQLLSRPVQRVTHDVSLLWGYYYSHVPEMPGPRVALPPTVEVRLYRDHAFDSRRIWRLASVHVDDKPAMIVRNAGRDGDDHASRYVFDLFAYRDLLTALGRRPTDRKSRGKTSVGWECSSVAGWDTGPSEVPDSARVDEFFGRNLDSPAEYWKPY